jgi:hypothetical protein
MNDALFQVFHVRHLKHPAERALAREMQIHWQVQETKQWHALG